MNKIFLAFIFILIYCSLYSQKTECGFAVGGSLFKGDVNTNFAFKETKTAISGYLRYSISKKFTLHPSILYTTLSGNDMKDESFSDKDIWRKSRNLSFRSRIIELSISSEYYLKDLKKKKSSPYTFIGIGIFYFNPRANYQGNWYNLKPLSTEGQGVPGYNVKEYKRLQPNALLGLGWKFQMNKKLSIGFEAGIRLTRTDFIDDVSGKYIDANNLAKYKGTTAAALSDRSGEFDYSSYVANTNNMNYGQEGTKRGNSKNFDKFIIYNFTFSYKIYKVKDS